MSLLCLDIGNTSAHWGLVDGRDVHASGDIPTAELVINGSSTLEQLLTKQRFTGIALASVVPAATHTTLPALTATKRPLHHLRHDTVRGLGFDYPTPAEVGQDRLANCIGAQLLTGAPAIVVDMGTATTFDVLTRRGYAGGIIAPGLGVMTGYLHARTALLPELDPAALLGGPIVGKSTVDAMRAGCAIGFAGMVAALLESVAGEIRRQGDGEPSVIATGGAAPFLPASWAGRIQYEPQLTLLGLAESFRRTHQ